MKLDIRLPIGLLFVVLGTMLMVYGALGDPTIYQRSLGININLGWGLIMDLFGGLMYYAGRRKKN